MPGGTATGGTAASGAVNPDADTVALLQFGEMPDALRKDIEAALAQAGLRPEFNGDATSTAARLKAFLASPLSKLFGVDGSEAIGQAFGAQLVNVTPAARQAFPAIFGPGLPLRPVLRAIMTQSVSLGKGADDFQTGVAKGLLSTGIPLAYVERADADPSHADAYRKLGILVVDDVDTAAGKTRLAQIMVGAITTQKAVDAVSTKTRAQVTPVPGDSPATVSWVILAMLGGAALFLATGSLRHRQARRTS